MHSYDVDYGRVKAKILKTRWELGGYGLTPWLVRALRRLWPAAGGAVAYAHRHGWYLLWDEQDDKKWCREFDSHTPAGYGWRSDAYWVSDRRWGHPLLAYAGLLELAPRA